MLMPRDSPLLQPPLLCERGSPSAKMQARMPRLDSLLLPPRLACEGASLWAKRQETQRVKVMPRSRLMRQAIRPEWATEPVQYKRLQMRLQKLAIKVS